MRSERKRVWLQIALFVITFVTTTLAGSQWAYQRSIYFGEFTWVDFYNGLAYSVPLLLILTVHEFGHYFLALYHKVRSTLPYYLPFPPIPMLPLNLGTMGAVIRLRSRPISNVQNFDIGVAGPLAGFIAALFVTFYGFQTLPPPEYVFQFHPEYAEYGRDYAEVVYTDEFVRDQGPVIDVQLGSNLLFWLFGLTVDDPARIPNSHELMHYPLLLACYIALLFTWLNLLPIGQLDGGHIVYGLFGPRLHGIIARAFFFALVFFAGLGLPYIDPDLPQKDLLVGIACYLLFLFIAFKGLNIPLMERVMFVVLMFGLQFSLMVFIPGVRGYEGWLLFVFILGRFVGIDHPRSEIERPLDAKRIIVGWIALLIFVLCFSPAPIRFEILTGEG